MKKYLIAMLLAMSLLLTACGSDAPAGEMAAAPVPSAATEAPAETEAIPEEKIASMGYMEGNTYVNEYAGYAVDLSGSWTISPAEVLQELPENVEELIRGTELGENHSALEQFTDILAENADTLQTMNLLYRKVSLQERLGYAIMSEQEILEGILEMQDQLIEAYTQAGILVEKMEIVDVTFLGQARKAIRMTSTIQEVPYITLQLFDFDKGQYALTLTLASYMEDTTETMLELFSGID